MSTLGDASLLTARLLRINDTTNGVGAGGSAGGGGSHVPAAHTLNEYYQVPPGGIVRSAISENSQQGYMLIGQVTVGSYDTALLFVLAVFVLNVLVALAAFCYFSPEMNPICGRRSKSSTTRNRATSQVLTRETVLDEPSEQVADIF